MAEVQKVSATTTATAVAGSTAAATSAPNNSSSTTRGNIESGSQQQQQTTTTTEQISTHHHPIHPYQSEPLPPKLKNILPPSPSQCTYTACYCEENVWKLCDKIRNEHPTEIDSCHVAFISNPKRMVPMWRQKSGKNEEKLALWDYHVILFYNPDDRCVVYDMDSDLPFPTHFHKYVTETFRTENILQAEYHRFFRVIPAPRFLQLFSSDRGHMKRQDGSWIKAPPNYPAICPSGGSNMEQFLDMTTPSNEYGELFNLMALVRRFYKPRQLS